MDRNRLKCQNLSNTESLMSSELPFSPDYPLFITCSTCKIISWLSQGQPRSFHQRGMRGCITWLCPAGAVNLHRSVKTTESGVKDTLHEQWLSLHNTKQYKLFCKAILVKIRTWQYGIPLQALADEVWPEVNVLDSNTILLCKYILQFILLVYMFLNRYIVSTNNTSFLPINLNRMYK